MELFYIFLLILLDELSFTKKKSKNILLLVFNYNYLIVSLLIISCKPNLTDRLLIRDEGFLNINIYYPIIILHLILKTSNML